MLHADVGGYSHELSRCGAFLYTGTMCVPWGNTITGAVKGQVRQARVYAGPSENL